jgi:hypothetical protein
MKTEKAGRGGATGRRRRGYSIGATAPKADIALAKFWRDGVGND